MLRRISERRTTLNDQAATMSDVIRQSSASVSSDDRIIQNQ